MNETTNLTPYLEVISKEKEPYEIIDEDGNTISVKVPNKLKHNDHEDCDNPVVHFNIGNVIKFYDARYISPKQPNPGESVVEVYEKHGFFADSDYPGFDKNPTRALRVIVNYANDRKTGENYTVTYYSYHKT